MRILFIGGTKRGYLTLAALFEHGHDVVGVLSLRQDAHETEQWADEIRELTRHRQCPHFESRMLKDRDYSALITQELRPDIGLVVGCRILLPRAIFAAPPRGTLAAHDSLLPDYRGFAPLNWSIINGETETGVTLFYLSDGMDDGDIVGQRTVAIGVRDTAPEVHQRVCDATIGLVLEALPLIAEGRAPRLPQDERQATTTCSRTPADGLIDWRARTGDIHNLVRGLTAPYPGAFTFHAGRPLTIWRAEPLDEAQRFVGRIPGRVVSVCGPNGSIDVLTGDGVLRVFEVQGTADSPVPANSIVRSVRTTLGLQPLDLLARIERLEAELQTLRPVPVPAPTPLVP